MITAATTGAVLVAGWVAGGVVAAPAAQAAACSGTTGVTVVVDFGSLGGGIQVGCAAGSPASGLSALSAAGFSYAFVPRQLGLVCQISAKPSPCNGAPTSAYWAYWHGQAGGSWTYSTQGAGSYHPPAGSVEGWAFGAGRQPGIGPPAHPAPPVPPKKPPKKPPTSHAGTVQPPASTPQPAGTSGTSKPAAGTTKPTTTPPSSSAGAAVVPTTPPPTTTGPLAPVADQRPARGGVSPGLVVAVLLIAVLAGLALWTRHRQARAAP